MAHIIGRQAERATLESVARSLEPEFVAIYGRRRVGKTYLVREYFEKTICFEIVGIKNATLRDQLDNFAHCLGKSLGIGIRPQRPNSWMEAFRQLETCLTSRSKKGRSTKRVVFIDELPWLETPRSKFLSSLEHFWNQWGSKQRDLALIVCGSAASFMIRNIVRAKGGLHNRLTRQIRLLPFSIGETEELLRSQGVVLTPIQIAEVYMAMGGVPYYLRQVEPGLSAAQVIDRIFFASGGSLRDEFDNLLSSLFDKSEQHAAIIRALARKRIGLTRGEVLQVTGLLSGGSTTMRLDELETSGFISSQAPFGKRTKDALYRLSDEYCQFYLDWIAKRGKNAPGEGYWLSLHDSPRRNAWAGFAFEGLCIKHVPQLKAALGIAGVATTQAPWRHLPADDSSAPGAQVDLAIDRGDRTINICEMKYCEADFTIDKKVADELRRKIAVFKAITGTRKNVLLTIVTTFGVTNNAYAKELVSNVVTLDKLFRA